MTTAVRPRDLPAGDEIEDALDREWKPGWRPVERDEKGRRRGRRYSRDIRAALDFLQFWFAPFISDWYEFEHGSDGVWRVQIAGDTMTKEGKGVRYECEGEAETLPLAICRAMLHTCDEDDE